MPRERIALFGMHCKDLEIVSKEERNEAQRRTKVSFGSTTMQALEMLWLAKRHISGQSNVEQ